MLKIQSDGKGYGKPVNPHQYYENDSFLSYAYSDFDRDNPTLPIYLPNGDPYLKDDVVEGEMANLWYDYNDGYEEWAFVKGDDTADEAENVRRLKNNGYTVIDCYRVHPVVDPLEKTAEFLISGFANPVVAEQAEVKTTQKQAFDLLQLQYELRQLLFVRPFDIHAIESAAIKLCDAIIDLSNLTQL